MNVNPRRYLLQRVCRRTGFVQTIVYTGNLRLKPRGWRLIEEV